ncbi:Do family serine endopeptidase [Propylenella binzhouense]|uniref:Probable periplasmic serine endoprotease DegP-like n=1 Tax=Propylenella binzhouense TaxID=2555902 RepID=A0A964T5H1_9HYPH|nr:Do family serine endopeptidase [Propylenella binzhouense]MYZ48878.1 Do family serine endopeptidase [Propylenella binzhouense]
MTNNDQNNSRARRFRNALLASALTLGIVGGTGAGLVIGDSPAARAEPVRVEAAGPADFTSIVEKVKPAVVSVRVKTEISPVSDQGSPFGDIPEDSPFYEFFKRFGPPGFEFRGPNGQNPHSPRFGMSQGSGFFISEDGYFVTNNHVVDHGKEMVVVMDDGRELDAKLIGTDEKTDLALLKVEGSGFTYVNFAQEEPKVGQWAIAVGNPFGLGGSVTAGIVSANGRDIGNGPYDDFIQIDAPVNRGNSGGPTFNAKGEVIGVNTAIFSPSGGNVGIAFAIPASTVQQVVADLKQDGKVTRGWLGVQIQPVTKDIADSLGIDQTTGALVADPQDNGPAKAAGVQAGDIIAKVDGKDVKGPRELAQIIAGYDPGATVTLDVVRNGSTQQIEVKLGNLAQVASTGTDQAPDAQPGSFEGYGLALAPNDGGDGVLVTGVDDGSAASEKGLQAGDVIVAVGGQKVSSVSDVKSGIASAQKNGRKAVLVQVQSERGTRFVALPVEKG